MKRISNTEYAKAQKHCQKKYLQELKTKLAEEVSRMRFFITGQRSDVTLGSTASEIEV